LRSTSPRTTVASPAAAQMRYTFCAMTAASAAAWARIHASFRAPSMPEAHPCRRFPTAAGV
jgi:hypothetical protein